MHLGVVHGRPLRAPRANRVFSTDEKRIRTENAVMDKSKNRLGLRLCKMLDCAWTISRPLNVAAC
jgi:hypothetical protein